MHEAEGILGNKRYSPGEPAPPPPPSPPSSSIKDRSNVTHRRKVTFCIRIDISASLSDLFPSEAVIFWFFYLNASSARRLSDSVCLNPERWHNDLNYNQQKTGFMKHLSPFIVTGKKAVYCLVIFVLIGCLCNIINVLTKLSVVFFVFFSPSLKSADPVSRSAPAVWNALSIFQQEMKRRSWHFVHY